VGIDLTGLRVTLRLSRLSTDTPLTDPETSRRLAGVVNVLYRQVFLFPAELTVTPACDIGSKATTCRARECEDCTTWQSLYRIAPDTAREPERIRGQLAYFAPAYWAIPSRCYLGGLVAQRVRPTSQVFYDFKTGNAALAFPLALGMREALRQIDAPRPDALVPIPLSPNKVGELHRARALAEELGLLLGLPVREAMSLSAPISKRASGLAKAGFEDQYAPKLVVDPERPVGRVLLVDDVCTHGSTLSTIALALKKVWPGVSVGATTAAQMIVKSAVVDESAVRA
jgi:predicted amidophosphoribosyltransferase